MTLTALISPGVTAALALALSAIAVASPLEDMATSTAPSGRHSIKLRSSITPGIGPGTSTPVRLTASNSGSSAVAITTVRLVDVAADAAHPTCVTEDFTMADVPQHASVPSGARDYQLASGTLTYKNTNISQDACQAATLTLTLSSTDT
ncbi:MAG: hypothetical protein ACR2LK_12560 [Solirubrobacteraceae bacterium]